MLFDDTGYGSRFFLPVTVKQHYTYEVKFIKFITWFSRVGFIQVYQSFLFLVIFGRSFESFLIYGRRIDV